MSTFCEDAKHWICSCCHAPTFAERVWQRGATAREEQHSSRLGTLPTSKGGAMPALAQDSIHHAMQDLPRHSHKSLVQAAAGQRSCFILIRKVVRRVKGLEKN